MTAQQVRRQCERICFDLIFDKDTIIRTGTFCQMPIPAFAKEHGWRSKDVKEALKELTDQGYLSELQFGDRSASFHLVIPKAFKE